MAEVHRKHRFCADCKNVGYIECHHLFGRKNICREPLASHPYFLLPLCRACHSAYHGSNPPSRVLEFQWRAIELMSQAVSDLVKLPYPVGSKEWMPVDAARFFDRELSDEDIYAA